MIILERSSHSLDSCLVNGSLHHGVPKFSLRHFTSRDSLKLRAKSKHRKPGLCIYIFGPAYIDIVLHDNDIIIHTHTLYTHTHAMYTKNLKCIFAHHQSGRLQRCHSSREHRGLLSERPVKITHWNRIPFKPNEISWRYYQ